MATISELMVKFGIDTSDVEKGMTGIQEQTKKFGDGMTGTGKKMTGFVTGPIMALSAGILALGVKTGQYADEVLDLVDITGMSSDSIQGWNRVAAHAGVSTTAVTDASQKLTKTMYQLETGSEKQTKALGKLSLSFEDLQKMSPDEQMDTLMKSLSDVEDPAERARIGTDLLGGAFKDIAPIVGMTSDEMFAMKQEGEDLAMSLEDLQEANGFRQEMEKLKAEFASTGRSLATQLMPLLKDTLLPLIRDTIVPAVTSFIEKIGSLAEKFSELSPRTQNIILGLVATAAAIGPLLIVVGKLATGFSALMGAAKFLIPIIGGISWPVLAVVAAIAAAIAIGVLLYKNWDTIKEKAIEIWDAIATWFSEVTQKIKDYVKENFEGVYNYIANYLEMAKGIITDVWNAIKRTFSNVLDFLKALVRGDFEGMKNAVKAQMENVRSLISSIWNRIKSFFSTVLSDIWGTVKQKFQDIVNSVQEKMSDAKQKVIDLWDEAQSFLTSIDLFQVGKDIIQGLINGIGSMVGAAIKKVTEVAGSIKDAITGFWRTSSPSRVAMDIGEDPIGVDDEEAENNVKLMSKLTMFNAGVSVA
ncbi:hypothetical protein [Alkalihalobacterium alkalinitrilicum]|uniref:hypothetical protein n=1 Tax=Alkalihalobacterium alkalinitrilicum TaxID=427920 RepID=UPI000994C90D|nr:hypothetical protein [Alkalihalobacterium alkalinitrilicum]